MASHVDPNASDSRRAISRVVLIAAALGVAVLVATAVLLVSFKGVLAGPGAPRPSLLAVAVGQTPRPSVGPSVVPSAAPTTSAGLTPAPPPIQRPRATAVAEPTLRGTSPTPRATRRPAPTARPGTTRKPTATRTPVPIENERSLNWGGYAVHGEGFTRVSASWTHPEVRCPVARPAELGIWVGLDGATSDTVEQIGTGASCALRTSPRHFVWWEMYPDEVIEIDMAVRPGDAIDAQVEARGASFTLWIRNRTTRASFRTVQVLRSAERSSAEWIVEPISWCRRGCEIAALPIFEPVRFTNATVRTSGLPTAITGSSGTLVRNDIESERAEHLLATTSAIEPGGRAFTVTWLDDK